MASAPMATPSFKSPANPAATSAAAEFSSTISRRAPWIPVSTSSSSEVLVVTSPPTKSSSAARGSPAISGVTRAAFSVDSPVSDSSTRATTDSPVVVSSSIPSDPCTTNARFAPSAASVRPTSSTLLGASTPITCARAPAGLVSGPHKFNMVLNPNARRSGPSAFIAGW